MAQEQNRIWCDSGRLFLLKVWLCTRLLSWPVLSSWDTHSSSNQISLHICHSLLCNLNQSCCILLIHFPFFNMSDKYSGKYFYEHETTTSGPRGMMSWETEPTLECNTHFGWPAGSAGTRPIFLALLDRSFSSYWGRPGSTDAWSAGVTSSL